MFYSQHILTKKGPLAKIWLAAHMQNKLTKTMVVTTDVEKSCESILQPEAPLALRLSSNLMLGVVRIYSKKTKYLMTDCSEAMAKMKVAFKLGANVTIDYNPLGENVNMNAITLGYGLNPNERLSSGALGERSDSISMGLSINWDMAFSDLEESQGEGGIDVQTPGTPGIGVFSASQATRSALQAPSLSMSQGRPHASYQASVRDITLNERSSRHESFDIDLQSAFPAYLSSSDGESQYTDLGDQDELDFALSQPLTRKRKQPEGEERSEEDVEVMRNRASIEGPLEQTPSAIHISPLGIGIPPTTAEKEPGGDAETLAIPTVLDMQQTPGSLRPSDIGAGHEAFQVDFLNGGDEMEVMHAALPALVVGQTPEQEREVARPARPSRGAGAATTQPQPLQQQRPIQRGSKKRAPPAADVDTELPAKAMRAQISDTSDIIRPVNTIRASFARIALAPQEHPGMDLPIPTGGRTTISQVLDVSGLDGMFQDCLNRLQVVPEANVSEIEVERRAAASGGVTPARRTPIANIEILEGQEEEERQVLAQAQGEAEAVAEEVLIPPTHEAEQVDIFAEEGFDVQIEMPPPAASSIGGRESSSRELPFMGAGSSSGLPPSISPADATRITLAEVSATKANISEESGMDEQARMNERTVKMVKYLATQFQSRAQVDLTALQKSERLNKRAASRTFYEILALSTKKVVAAKQDKPYGKIVVEPTGQFNSIISSLNG